MKRFNQMIALAVLALVAIPGSALADDSEDIAQVEPPPETQQETSSPAESPSDASQHSLQLAVGFKGGVNGVAGHGFENNESVSNSDGNSVPSGGGDWPYPEYYGHFGMGGTGGVSLDIRYAGIVGLELGFLFSQDNASGYVDKNLAGSNQTIARINSQQRTSALHIPVMLKVNMPSDFVRPYFSAGMQFVVQTSSEIEYDQEEQAGRYGSQDAMETLNERNQIEESTYPLLAAAAGVEFVAGPVKIPVELRFGYALGFDQAMEERARANDDQIIYDGVYMGHFGIFAGVLYEFDLL